MKCFGMPVFILLLLLSSTAFAEAYRCTDAQGSVSYTNTECQSGSDVKNVKDQTNLMDYSKERQFVERQMAKAKANAGTFSELESMNTSVLMVRALGRCAGIWALWSNRH